MTWLVVCQDSDPEARWMASGLAERGLDPCVVVTASELVHDAAWVHTLGSSPVKTIVSPAGGVAVLDSREVEGVVNRLYWLTADGYRKASDPDREYAGAEWNALAQSWLAGYGGRVLNPPAHDGLCGSVRSDARWKALARTVGLRAAPHSFRADSPLDPPAWPPVSHWVTVVGDAVLGGDDLPASIRAGLDRLRCAARLDLFDAIFVGPAEWPELHTVSVLPGLRRFGAVGLDALAVALEKAAAR